MGLGSRQRKRCNELADAVIDDRDAMADAGRHLLEAARDKISSPAGLVALFGAGLLAGGLVYRRELSGDTEATDETHVSEKKPGMGSSVLSAIQLLSRL